MSKRILIIESNNSDYLLIKKQLTEIICNDNDVCRCLLVEESLSAQNEEIDIILAKFSSLPEVLPGLLKIKARFMHLPVIVLSDKDDRDVAIQSIQNGAQDFLVTGTIDASQLDRAISFAIERKARSTKIINLTAEYEKQFDNGPIPMCLVDSKTMKFLVVNKAVVEKYGYSKEELSQMSLLDIRPKEDISSFVTKYNQKSAEYYDAGYARHLKKSGETFYVHVYSHATLFNGVEARLSFLVDVNEKLLADQRNAELANLIKKQKEQLDNILSSISDAIWSRRADTIELVYANDAYCKLFGYSHKDGRTDRENMLKAVCPDDLPAFLQAMEDIKTMGKVELVYRHIHKDGSLKTLKVKAELKAGTDGQPDMINGVTNDITQEKELFDIIRNSEQKLRATIDNTKDLIWSVDRELKILFCNKAFQDFFYKLAGVRLDEGDYILGDWRSASFINKRKRDYQRAFDGESFSTVVEEHCNGETLYFEISSNPIIDVSGKVAGVNCTSRDITEQTMQLIKIQRQTEKLKDIADIQSHKVRGPVASILGLIPLFDYNAAGNNYNAGILERLHSATSDLDEIIKEIVAVVNAGDTFK